MGVMNVSYLTVNGEILSETRNGVESDYVPDPLGSTAALIGVSQTITDTFAWWPYGELRSHSGSSATPIGYVGTLGYYTDGGSDRLTVGARVYTVKFARFLVQDSFEMRALGEHAYVYCQNNPSTLVDPSGESAEICYRNVVPGCGAMGHCHWYVRSSQCGAFGYGQSGVTFGVPSQGGNSSDPCEPLSLTDSQEKCMCDIASALGSHPTWIFCGTTWNGAEYAPHGHNCQQFIYGLLMRCRGRTGPWGTWGDPDFGYKNCLPKKPVRR